MFGILQFYCTKFCAILYESWNYAMTLQGGDNCLLQTVNILCRRFFFVFSSITAFFPTLSFDLDWKATSSVAAAFIFCLNSWLDQTREQEFFEEKCALDVILTLAHSAVWMLFLFITGHQLRDYVMGTFGWKSLRKEKVRLRQPYHISEP